MAMQEYRPREFDLPEPVRQRLDYAAAQFAMMFEHARTGAEGPAPRLEDRLRGNNFADPDEVLTSGEREFLLAAQTAIGAAFDAARVSVRRAVWKATHDTLRDEPNA